MSAHTHDHKHDHPHSHGHDHDHPHDHSHGHSHSHDHTKIYFLVLVGLFFLTAVTVGVSYIDLGSANVGVALFVASIKATLVGMFFMHLKYDKPINAFICGTGFFFLGLLITFCILDIDNRTDQEPAGLKVKKAVAAAPAADGAATPGGAPAAAPAGAPAATPAPAHH